MAYQIYQKNFNPKKETIRIHIKQRVFQVYTIDSQRKNIFNFQEVQTSFNKRQQQKQQIFTKKKSQIKDNEDQSKKYIRAQQIIDEQKQKLQKPQIKKQESINQDILIVNLLNKQTIKTKKQAGKLELYQTKEVAYPLPLILQENQIRELKYGQLKQKIKKNPQSLEVERNIQLLNKKQTQPQLQAPRQKITESKALDQNYGIKKIVEECELILEPTLNKQQNQNKISDKKGKIIRKEFKEISSDDESHKIEQKKQTDIKFKQSEINNLNNQLFDIEINLTVEMSSIQSPEKNAEKNIVDSKKIVQIEFKEIKEIEKNIVSENIRKQLSQEQDDSQELFSFPKFKLEREYLNDIIVTQRKKELEIYRSGNLYQVIKKDPKAVTKPRTSQQLQEDIQRLQLEKIASNKTSRCSVPIIPKNKEKESQVSENEVVSYERNIYNQQLQLKAKPKLMIESIISHQMLNNQILFKCLCDSKDECFMEYQNLTIYCPTLLLDYMRVNSILI